jgi:hypothetical protein
LLDTEGINIKQKAKKNQNSENRMPQITIERIVDNGVPETGVSRSPKKRVKKRMPDITIEKNVEDVPIVETGNVGCGEVSNKPPSRSVDVSGVKNRLPFTVPGDVEANLFGYNAQRFTEAQTVAKAALSSVYSKPQRKTMKTANANVRVTQQLDPPVPGPMACPLQLDYTIEVGTYKLENLQSADRSRNWLVALGEKTWFTRRSDLRMLYEHPALAQIIAEASVEEQQNVLEQGNSGPFTPTPVALQNVPHPLALKDGLTVNKMCAEEAIKAKELKASQDWTFSNILAVAVPYIFGPGNRREVE